MSGLIVVVPVCILLPIVPVRFCPDAETQKYGQHRANMTTMSHCAIPSIDAYHLYISPRYSSALEQCLQRPQAGPFSQDGMRRHCARRRRRAAIGSILFCRRMHQNRYNRAPNSLYWVPITSINRCWAVKALTASWRSGGIHHGWRGW